jgi:hypothetical protein
MKRTQNQEVPMTFTAANVSLKPGWKIVREGKQFALLWQSRQAKLGRYKVLAVGSLREVMAAYHELTGPLPGGRA